jgi:hypothetical protein
MEVAHAHLTLAWESREASSSKLSLGGQIGLLLSHRDALPESSSLAFALPTEGKRCVYIE